MNLKMELQRAFANINVMYIKSTNFHYNSVGSNFLSIHKFYEKQYEIFYDWTDIVGELLKKANWEVNPKLSWFTEHSTVQEANGETRQEDTLKSMLKSFMLLRKDFTQLAKQDESVTISDAFTTILHEIDKQIWFMEALLK